MKKVLPWVAAFVILVVVFGTIYGVVQQSQRREANYPQVQLAEDAAAALDRGTSPQKLMAGRVDMSHSLAPFVIIYNRSGDVVAGSGYLDRHVPRAPLGMLANARSKIYHAITWQPRSDVRIASVTVAAGKYYVLSGRSLTEVEKNESRSFQLSLMGGVISAVILGLAFVLYNRPLYNS